MSLQRSVGQEVDLTCPNCAAVLPTRAASCRTCHLPMADVVRHQRNGTRRRAALTSRLWGLLAYAGIVVWCLVAIPTAAAFVVPAAAVGAVLHVLRGRPVVGGLVFVLIIAIAPLLLWPAMGTEVLDDLASYVGR